jgi:hypothetical protein
MMSGSSQRYLPTRFPRIWQIKLLWCVAYSFGSALIAWGVCRTLTDEMKANAIPELTFWYQVFLILSLIATLFWIFKATQHFRVGVSGYKIASPPLIMLFITICLLWLAPAVFAYFSCVALRATAGAEDASAGYLRIQRVASLLNSNAETHYEPLKLQPPIESLESTDKFTVAFIKSVAAAAAQPIATFAPSGVRALLLRFLDRNISTCAELWGSKSKTEVLASVRDDIAERTQQAQTEAERNAIDTDRAVQSDRIDAEYDRYVRLFRECLTSTIEQAKLDKSDIVRGFKTAERNAYMVQYAYKALGQGSADYRQFVSDQQFAAPELSSVGLGDLAVLAWLAWFILSVSIFYLAGEYADSAAIASVSRNTALIVISGFLILSFFSFASPIPKANNNPTIADTFAAALHWPALIAIVFAILAIFGTLMPTSTKMTRSAILATYLLLPAVIAIETLNVVNTFNVVDYTGGSCPRGSWALADQLHCSVYAVLKPLARTWSVWIANQLRWNDFQMQAGSRVAVCVILTGAITWGATSGILVLLKREFVRPRDK